MAQLAAGLPRRLNLPTSHSVTLGGVRLTAYRWLVVACELATLQITWPLWQVHRDPPMLWALPLPQVDLGPLLVLSLAGVLLWPRYGVPLHTVLVLYAILIDQTRLQPEIVSFLFLLWGTLPYPNIQALARAHLVALWLFSGFHKLFDPLFLTNTAPWILGGVWPSPPLFLQANIGYLAAAGEMALAVLALVPRTRPLAAGWALALHGSVLVALKFGVVTNDAVVPWNVALAFAGLALILPWKESPARTLAACRPAVRALVLLVLLMPVGYYFGVTDAYLAHNLYSEVNPRAEWCLGNVWCRKVDGMTPFKVPLPPEPRLFESYFMQVCAPGDRLQIVDPRWWARQRGLDQRELWCPGTGAPAGQAP